MQRTLAIWVSIWIVAFALLRVDAHITEYLYLKNKEVTNEARYLDWQYHLADNEAMTLRNQREKSCLKDNPKRKELCYK